MRYHSVTCINNPNCVYSQRTNESSDLWKRTTLLDKVITVNEMLTNICVKARSDRSS